MTLISQKVTTVISADFFYYQIQFYLQTRDPSQQQNPRKMPLKQYLMNRPSPVSVNMFV